MGVTQSCARACECSTDKKFSKTLAEAHLSAEEIDALTEEIEAWCDSHRLLLSPRDFLSRLKGKDLGYEELQDFAKRAPPEAVTGIYADCLRSRLASLVSLELSCFPLSDRDIATPLGNFLEFTAKELGDLSRIQVVDLSYTNISSRALRAVAVPLGRLPTFSVLNLSNNGGEATVDGRLSFSGEGFINFLADLLSTTRYRGGNGSLAFVDLRNVPALDDSCVPSLKRLQQSAPGVLVNIQGTSLSSLAKAELEGAGMLVFDFSARLSENRRRSV